MIPDAQLATPPRSWIRRYIFSTAHRTIGVQYFLLALASVLIGITLSLFMRIHLVWPNLPIPGWGIIKPEDYLALVTMHGTLMVFFVLTLAPLNAFSNLVLPEQIGARRMSLPWLNALSFWISLAALLVLIAAFFVPAGAPISGWTNYPPLSAIAAAGPGEATGMDCWLISIALFCIGSTCAAVNLLATVTKERCRGMLLRRVPLTVWSWYVASMLVVLVFSVLFAAALLLFCDRHFSTSFFVPNDLVINGQTLPRRGDGSPLLWLHLFWFFGHPEVYIAILPGMGLASTLVANFSRRRISNYKLMVATTWAIAILGLVVWGHHMFVSGMNPYAGSAFALTTMAIALPSTIKVLAWLRTLWRAQLRLVTPMLFTLGFISLFITGGLTGPILAMPMLDAYLHNTYFVLAHFHLVMGMAAVFAIFAATYYWFPLVTGRMMSERLGKLHFWLSFIAAYAAFFPMHFAGLAGLPRHYAELGGTQIDLSYLRPLQMWISISAFVLIAAQLIFFINLIRSLPRGAPALPNPWQATTLEWAPPAWFADPARSINIGPYEYVRNATQTADFLPQWEPLPTAAPEE